MNDDDLSDGSTENTVVNHAGYQMTIN